MAKPPYRRQSAAAERSISLPLTRLNPFTHERREPNIENRAPMSLFGDDCHATVIV
jgi:hypothetical protein